MNKHIMATDCSSFDIICSIKTEDLQSKKTTWSEMVDNGIVLAGETYGENDKAVNYQTGMARMGLMTGLLGTASRELNPDFAKLFLPEVNGTINGIGEFAVVGYTKDSKEPHPLMTVVFVLKQVPGEPIKVSMNIGEYFDVEEGIRRKTSNLMVRDLFYGLESYHAKHRALPLVEFKDTVELPSYFKKKRFSPSLSRITRENGDRLVVIHVREHTPETDVLEISPPHLFTLNASEEDGGGLEIRYEGRDEQTPMEKMLVTEVILAFRDVLYGENEGRPTTVTNVLY